MHSENIFRVGIFSYFSWQIMKEYGTHQTIQSNR